jgi:hypothetical protein
MGEVELARHWQLAVLRRQQNQEQEAFENRLRCRPGGDRILLARSMNAAGEAFWVGLERHELKEHHAWIMGATGSGKSYLVLAALWQLLKDPETPIVLLDRKGELAELLLDLVLPSLTDEPGFGKLLGSLRVIRPFDTTRVPLLRLTDPEPGISREVQAMNLAASLEDALGQDLGIRMNRVFLRLVLLAIELGKPLTVLSRWLSNPAVLARDGLRSADPELRAYARTGFAQESASSLEALASRLDMFLFLPETRLALSAPQCLSLSESLESGLTIIDVGNPPAGAERVARFWGGVLIGRLSRAIMSRKVEEKSPQTLIVLEEFQESLSSGSVEQFARLLALSRFKKVALWFVNQQPGQLASVDPALPKLLRTNTSLEMIFRSNFEDAKAIGPALLRPAKKDRRKRDNEIEVADLTSLPDRAFYLWLKKESFGAQRVRSPRLDLKAMQDAAARVSMENRMAIHQGTVTIDRKELEALLRSDEERQGLGEERLPKRPLDLGTDGQFPRLG